MRKKRLFELPFLHSNLKGKVLYIRFLSDEQVMLESRTIDPIVQAISEPLPFKAGDFDSFYIDNLRGTLQFDFLFEEVCRISRAGSVILYKMFVSPQYEEVVSALKNNNYLFDKSIIVPTLKKFWHPRKVYSTFNYFKITEETILKTITAIIPMFNNEQSITKALGSIEVQTYPVHEVVVIDDGSTDKSIQVVNEYAKTSKLNIRLITQANAGPSKARNVGIKNATGELVAFLDADDSWSPDKILIQVQILESFPQAGLISCNRNNEKFPKFLVFGFGEFVRLPLKIHLIKNFCPTPTVLVRTQILRDVNGFDESMSRLEDLDLWIRISQKYDCYLLNRSLAYTGDGKPNFGYSGLSRNIWKMEVGELKCIHKVYSAGWLAFLEYLFFTCYSLIKFLRRVVIVIKQMRLSNVHKNLKGFFL